jgi:hypothetical protein
MNYCQLLRKESAVSIDFFVRSVQMAHASLREELWKHFLTSIHLALFSEQ